MLQSTIIRLLLILVILLSGCSLQYESYPNDDKAPSTDNVVEVPSTDNVVKERFIKTRFNNICFVIMDTKTENEYLVVPNAGVIKLN
jgi:PBP1b-binding outer membrane lipoprotein LpoB